MKRQATEATARPDYARIWRRLKPDVRNRRIGQALTRLAEGETLEQVGTTWDITAASLCRALIAWAPCEWRAALVSQTIAQAEAIANGQRKLTRAQERLKLLEWRMKRTLRAGPLQALGHELIGPCPECKHPRSVYVRAKRPAQCFECGWEGDRQQYLTGAVK
jgi:hypothetical protein